MVRWIGPISDKGKGEPEKEVVAAEGRESVFGRRTTLVLSVGSFALSLLFLSGNITGNVVSDFVGNGALYLGVVFFVLAILGFFLYTRKK